MAENLGRLQNGVIERAFPGRQRRSQGRERPLKMNLKPYPNGIGPVRDSYNDHDKAGNPIWPATTKLDAIKRGETPFAIKWLEGNMPRKPQSWEVCPRPLIIERTRSITRPPSASLSEAAHSSPLVHSRCVTTASPLMRCGVGVELKGLPRRLADVVWLRCGGVSHQARGARGQGEGSPRGRDRSSARRGGIGSIGRGGAGEAGDARHQAGGGGERGRAQACEEGGGGKGARGDGREEPRRSQARQSGEALAQKPLKPREHSRTELRVHPRVLRERSRERTKDAPS
jgi:hypothetical protein